MTRSAGQIWNRSLWKRWLFELRLILDARSRDDTHATQGCRDFRISRSKCIRMPQSGFRRLRLSKLFEIQSQFLGDRKFTRLHQESAVVIVDGRIGVAIVAIGLGENVERLG